VREDGHAHHHAVPVGASGGTRRALAAVLALSCAVLLLEVAGAVLTRSLALLADAGHLLIDVAGLALAFFAAVLAERPPTPQRTWGYRRAEVLAAAAQAAALLAVGGVVVVEAVRRLVSPPAVDSPLMLGFGLVALAANLVGLALLVRLRGESLNTRAAFLEVVSDALGAVAVIAAALVIGATGWARADPLASLAIGVLIGPRTVRLLRETLAVLLESTPPGLELELVRRHIIEVEHVVDVHDVHATLVATGLPVVTAHVVVDDECFHDGHVPRLLDALQQCLAGHFDVEHSTFQFEPVSHAEHEHARHP
jgi:cobalt-zinc-cadmium efflux system protein